MNLYRLLRFLIPMQNPPGFTLADFVALAVAVIFVVTAIWRSRIEHGFRWVAARPRVAMPALILLPMLLRLSLLQHHPIPYPTVSDDFSYLLLGDTLAHFRLANPVHPMHRFFETVFVVQQPSYSSIYPLGQGLVLALGQLVFHCPWVGVLISASAVSAAVYWMLRGWVPPTWALAGGLIATMQLGPLNQWMNNYWGGALSAIAGCLVFGAIGRRRYGAPLGWGLALQMLTRPFEALLLVFCLYPLRRRWPRITLLVPIAIALVITGFHNRAVSGSFTTLPYALSRAQYGIPTTFTFQQLPIPQNALTQEQQLDYLAQNEVHGNEPESLFAWLLRLAGRIRFVRFFLLPALYLALPFALPALRYRRWRWAAASAALVFAGTGFYPYFYPHYIAALACLFILFAMKGLMRMPPAAARLLLTLCGAHFILWYSVHLFGNNEVIAATGRYESWDYINYGDAEHRAEIERQLQAEAGAQLVFIHYSPQHLLREWLSNDADIDASHVVRALDLGTEENARLIAWYPHRRVWMLEPDANPPRLTSYAPQ